ncbi:MAG: PE-PPE domain-containing protein [Mycobacterium sp.]|uniref:PE-PPE domain-containing protein n=1 Tax=Mycobacterium sp. TaxID=1785 RepID=UPI00389A33D2
MKKSLAAAAATGTMLLTAPAAGAMTYTLEPTDFDGVLGIVVNVTQQQLGGTLCPCTKIPYPADGLSITQGVAALASAPLKAGDIVLGFSLGSVVASAYLNSHTPPPGVTFILLGDTSNPNGRLAAIGLLALFGGGIPPNTPDPVTIISRQYDGWADWPDNIFAPGYLLAVMNAVEGGNTIHNDYTEASLLNNPANVTWTQGNITYELVPTQHLPINQGWRNIGLGFVADALDAIERSTIDAAYTTRPNPTAAQLAASTSEQAKIPSPVQIPGPPEPVATLNPPSTGSVLTSSTNRTPTPAPAEVATKVVTQPVSHPAPTSESRPRGATSLEAGSEVQSPRRGTIADLTKPLTTKPAEAASDPASKPSLQQRDSRDLGASGQRRQSEVGGQAHDDRNDGVGESGRHRK